MNKIVVVLVIAVFASLALSIGAFTGLFVAGGPSRMDYFAQCLSDKGVVMYGFSSCDNCNSNRQLFGNSFKYVSYTDCAFNLLECRDAGVEGVPAWKVNGILYTGIQTPERLSELTGCPL
jgi:hypothetical protein